MSDERERRRPRRSHSQDVRLPANVKPRMDNRRPQNVRRSRSSDSERGRRRERRSGEPNQHRHRHQHQRGRSADAGRRVRPPEESDEEELECAICFCSYDNTFKTPKLLACGHTFCLECLARINVSAPELKTLTCPVCREITDIPHGQDLPRLGNNQDIIGKLPPEMRRAKSIRFKRSKGKLFLKNPAPNSNSPANPGVITLPHKSHEAQAAPADALRLDAMEGGAAPATMVDVGRPPNRVRGRIRRFFRSDRCYYITVASVITITVALLLAGILAFVIIPNVTSPRPPPGNQTAPRPPSRNAFSTGP